MNKNQIKAMRVILLAALNEASSKTRCGELEEGQAIIDAVQILYPFIQDDEY